MFDDKFCAFYSQEESSEARPAPTSERGLEDSVLVPREVWTQLVAQHQPKWCVLVVYEHFNKGTRHVHMDLIVY